VLSTAVKFSIEKHERTEVEGAGPIVCPPPSLVSSLSPAGVLSLQRHAGNRAVTGWLSGRGPTLQRRELPAGSTPTTAKDWTTADRERNTQRWKDACLAHLNAADSSQYERIVERRDFYRWFYEHTAARGFHTRWALAASLVANGAHQIADMDVDHDLANETLGLANVELQGAMREGNQVIFDNVLPKLKKLYDGGPLKGRAALEFDMQILSEEQVLIQPMYDRMSKETIQQMDYIARKKRFAGWGADWTDEENVAEGPFNKGGVVPAFGGSSLLSVKDRWTYGMKLGDQFTKGGTGFDPNKDPPPAAGFDYWNGKELATVDTRANLHQLDAFLNPHRVSRTGPGSDAKATVGRLTLPEKMRVLSDRSPDGWSYSHQFAQFVGIDPATVQQALPPPTSPGAALSIAAFMARFHAERSRVDAKLKAVQMQGPPF
jgi:hypothetical protein